MAMFALPALWLLHCWLHLPQPPEDNHLGSAALFNVQPAPGGGDHYSLKPSSTLILWDGISARTILLSTIQVILSITPVEVRHPNAEKHHDKYDEHTESIVLYFRLLPWR